MSLALAQLDQTSILFSTYAGGIYKMSTYDQTIEKFSENGLFRFLACHEFICRWGNIMGWDKGFWPSTVFR